MPKKVKVRIDSTFGDGIDAVNDIIRSLRMATRCGNEKDSPEGSRYIIISDTLARRMVDSLKSVLDRMRSEAWVDDHLMTLAKRMKHMEDFISEIAARMYHERNKPPRGMENKLKVLRAQFMMHGIPEPIVDDVVQWTIKMSGKDGAWPKKVLGTALARRVMEAVGSNHKDDQESLGLARDGNARAERTEEDG